MKNTYSLQYIPQFHKQEIPYFKSALNVYSYKNMSDNKILAMA